MRIILSVQTEQHKKNKIAKHKLNKRRGEDSISIFNDILNREKHHLASTWLKLPYSATEQKHSQTVPSLKKSHERIDIYGI